MSHIVKIYKNCIGCVQCVRACPCDVLEMVPRSLNMPFNEFSDIVNDWDKKKETFGNYTLSQIRSICYSKMNKDTLRSFRVPLINKMEQRASANRDEDCIGCKRCETACPTDFLSVRVYFGSETTRSLGLAY